MEKIETDDESNTIEAFHPAIDHEIQEIPLEPNSIIAVESQEHLVQEINSESKLETDEHFFLSNSCDDKLDQKSPSTNQKLGCSTEKSLKAN